MVSRLGLRPDRVLTLGLRPDRVLALGLRPDRVLALARHARQGRVGDPTYFGCGQAMRGRVRDRLWIA